MAERVWDKFLTEQDKAVMAACGFGGVTGFGKRPVLLVIDFGWAFIGDRPQPLLEMVKTWPMASGESGWNAMRQAKRLIDAFHARNLPVVYTTYKNRQDGWDKTSWRWKNPNTNRRPPGASANLDIQAIVDDIAPAPRDIVIYKQKPSAFFGTNLGSYLTYMGADSIVAIGGVTSGCLRASVTDAFSLNYKVTVAEEACFDRNEASHAINLCDMAAKYADVLPIDDVLAFVDTLPGDLFPDAPQG